MVEVALPSVRKRLAPLTHVSDRFESNAMLKIAFTHFNDEELESQSVYVWA